MPDVIFYPDLSPHFENSFLKDHNGHTGGVLFIVATQKKKKELENNWNIFERCVLNPFHEEKRKRKLFFRKEVESGT